MRTAMPNAMRNAMHSGAMHKTRRTNRRTTVVQVGLKTDRCGPRARAYAIFGNSGATIALVTDDPRLAALGQYTPEGQLTPGYGDHYLFLVGRDDVHGILHSLIPQETIRFRFNMFGYDDDVLNADIMALLKNPTVSMQATLDKSQAGGVHEKALLAADEASDPQFLNSFVIGESATHQISHTKGGVFDALGLGFEGSTNWSASGEGTGVPLKPGLHTAGFKAQNNTLLVSSNPVFLSRFATRLDLEHQMAARAA